MRSVEVSAYFGNLSMCSKSVVGMKMVMMFWVSQKPVIMTSTCNRLRPLGPEMRSLSGVFSRFALDVGFPDLGFRNHEDVVEHEKAGEQRPNHEGNAPPPLRVSRVRPCQRKDCEHQHGDERNGDVSGGKGGEDEAAGEAALLFLGIFDCERMSPGKPPPRQMPSRKRRITKSQ